MMERGYLPDYSMQECKNKESIGERKKGQSEKEKRVNPILNTLVLTWCIDTLLV